jgi:hypothetical protein
MTSATYDDNVDDDDDVILMIIQFNKVCLHAESTAVGPVTETAQTTYEIFK